VVSTQRFLRQFWAAEQAQDMVEYAMVLAVIVLAGIGVSGILARPVNMIWTITNNNLSTAISVANTQ
jgi:Flp pilus assembly pilin Flp